jgi:hypothetical protein
VALREGASFDELRVQGPFKKAIDRVADFLNGISLLSKKELAEYVYCEFGYAEDEKDLAIEEVERWIEEDLGIEDGEYRFGLGSLDYQGNAPEAHDQILMAMVDENGLSIDAKNIKLYIQY